MSKYKSPFSVDYRTPIFIDSNDPRAQKGNFEKNYTRHGRDIEIVEGKKPIELEKIKLSGYFGSFVGISSIPISQNRTISNGIVVDNLNNTYTTGSFTDYDAAVERKHTDIYITKHNKNGELIWQKCLKSEFSSQSRNASGNGIALDSQNNIYVVGSYYADPIQPRSVAFIIKYDNDGILQWQKQLSINNSLSYKNTTHCYAISIDSLDNIYITGYADNNYSNTYSGNIFLVKYDSLGNLQWQKFLKQSSSNSAEESSGISIITDSLLNVYISGFQISHKPFIIKYNKDGILVWQKSFDINSVYETVQTFSTFKNTIGIDTNSNIYIAGSFYGESLYTYYGFLIKISPSGSIILSKKIYNNDDPTQLIINKVVIDNSGNIKVVGHEGAFQPVGIVLKINSNYKIELSKTISGGQLRDIVVDKDSNFFVTGTSYMNSQLCSLNAKLPYNGQKNGTYILDANKQIIYANLTNIQISNATFNLLPPSFIESSGTLDINDSQLIDAGTRLAYSLKSMW